MRANVIKTTTTTTPCAHGLFVPRHARQTAIISTRVHFGARGRWRWVTSRPYSKQQSQHSAHIHAGQLGSWGMLRRACCSQLQTLARSRGGTRLGGNGYPLLLTGRTGPRPGSCRALCSERPVALFSVSRISDQWAHTVIVPWVLWCVHRTGLQVRQRVPPYRVICTQLRPLAARRPLVAVDSVANPGYSGTRRWWPSLPAPVPRSASPAHKTRVHAVCPRGRLVVTTFFWAERPTPLDRWAVAVCVSGKKENTTHKIKSCDICISQPHHSFLAKHHTPLAHTPTSSTAVQRFPPLTQIKRLTGEHAALTCGLRWTLQKAGCQAGGR